MNWRKKQAHEEEVQRIGEYYDNIPEEQVVAGVQHCILPIAHEGEHLYAAVPSNFWKCDKVKKEADVTYQVNCTKCDCCIFVRGAFEPDTNATVLDDDSPAWDDGCDHIKNGDYEIFAEADEELLEDYSADHGDSVWPK